MTRISTLLTICSAFLHLYIIMVLEISTSAGNGCVAPVPLPVFHHGDEDLTAAINSMQCELGCIKQNGVTLTQLDTETGWPSVEFDSLNNNCPLYQKVHECKAGCLRRYSEPTLPINRCRDGCYTQCTNEQCNGEDSCQHQVDLICPRQCRKTYCKFGCLVHDTVVTSITSNSHSLPAQPTSPPVLENLTDNEEKWLYNVHTRTAIPAATSSVASNQTQYPIAYLLKISSSVTNILRYVWQRNLSTPLDLSPFACSNVSISFAVISQLTFPTSVQFSPEKIISVPGLGGRPSQVNVSSFSVRYTEDFRDGFIGYSVANVTWTRPSGSEFLSSYQLRVFPDSDICGGDGHTYTYTAIDKEAANFVIQAGRANGLMKFGCSYIFEILAFPTNDLIGPHITSVSELTGPPPVMSLNCQRVWDASGHFNISLNWSFPDAAQISHITQFVVTPVLQNSGPIRNSYHLTRTEEWSNNFSVMLSSFLPQVNSTRRLMVEVKSLINASYSWRELPPTQSCIVKMSPIPPNPPRDILVRNITFDDMNKRLTFNVQWSPPNAAHGELTKYKLFIGEEVQAQSSGDIRQEGFVQLFEDSTTETEINRVLNVSEDIHCLQLQMRAYNNYSFSSNWSEPLAIPLDDECRIGPDAAKISNNSSSEGDSAEGNIAVYLERDEVGSVKLLELGCNSDSALFGTNEDGISAQLLSLGARVDSILSQVISNQQVEEKVISLQEKLNNIEHKLDVLMDFVAQRANQGS